MLPFPVSRANVAVLIVDLQNWYCDSQSEMALHHKWDCRPMHEVCNRHVPFVSQLRSLLPPQQIIWVRRIPNGREIKCKEDFKFLSSLPPGGFGYHVVKPTPFEAEALKAHPSVFHKHARVHTIGSTEITLRYGTQTQSHPPMHIDTYMDQIGVDTLAVTGVLGPHCVYASVLGASIFDRKCLCLTDLIAVPGGRDFQVEAEAHARTRDLFYAKPVTGNDFLSALRPENRAKFRPEEYAQK